MIIQCSHSYAICTWPFPLCPNILDPPLIMSLLLYSSLRITQSYLNLAGTVPWVCLSFALPLHLLCIWTYFIADPLGWITFGQLWTRWRPESLSKNALYVSITQQSGRGHKYVYGRVRSISALSFFLRSFHSNKDYRRLARRACVGALYRVFLSFQLWPFKNNIVTEQNLTAGEFTDSLKPPSPREQFSDVVLVSTIPCWISLLSSPSSLSSSSSLLLSLLCVSSPSPQSDCGG